MDPMAASQEKTVFASSVADVKDGESWATPTWTPETEKALVRKIDLRIFPVMVILFILNFIDRNNFANAKLKGLEADLQLTDVQYDTCISILLVGYVCMQVPSNMVLTSLRYPRLYLCTCIAIWGVISAATAATHNAAGAIMCRFFLGCVEASFFPGSIYFLSRWYTRKEMQLRVTLLNAGNLAAQAFGSLIAAGILGGMQGKRGLAAWRWLFIIEGAVTVAVAGLSTLVLPDYPRTTPWLSPEEKAIALARLEMDCHEAHRDALHDDTITAKEGFWMAVRDKKVWLLGATYFSTIFGLSFSVFFPTITASLGFNSTDTLLLAAPPWIFAIFVSLPNAWHADRTGERYFHYAWPAITCMVGYIISACTSVWGPRYFSMFLMTVGYASGFVMLAWISNTIPGPPAKKATAIAMVNAMGNIGTIPGSYIWPSKWAKMYSKSFGIEIAVLGCALCLGFALRTYLAHLNKKLDAEEGVGSADSGEEQSMREKGFRYLY